MIDDKKVHRPAFLSLFVIMLWMAGCSGSGPLVDNRPDLPDAFPNHTLAEVHQQLRLAAGDTLNALQGKASVSMRTPAYKGNVTARLQHRRNDSLYMSLTATTLNIEGARMLVTPDSFFYYDRINKQVNYGSMAYAEDILPPLLTAEAIFPNLLGMLLPDPDENWQFDADTAYYHLRDADGRRRYMIDPTVWRVVQFEERTSQGTLVEARSFTEFDTFDGVFVPRRIILRRPLDDTSISMYYRELTLNPPTLSLNLRVGDSVEWVLIDENTDFSND